MKTDWHSKVLKHWYISDKYSTSMVVGCIYASEPFNSSLIYYQRLFHSNSINKHQKQLKYILSIFLVFLLTLFPCHLYFLRYMSYEGLCLCFRLDHLIPGRGSAYWHIGSTWRFGRLMAKALKCRVSRYMRVRHIRICPLSSVSTITEEVSIGVIV